MILSELFDVFVEDENVYVILIRYLALSYLANIIDFGRLLVHPVSMTQVFALNPLSSVYEFE